MTNLTLPPEIRPNKTFIFKGKKYQVDFNMIKQYSHFFYDNQAQYEQLEEIELPDEKMEVTNDDFQNFISCCQNQNFQLSKSNVFAMYQLSLKYNVPSLLKITNEYIEKNHSDLIFDFFEYKYQNQLDFQDEENALSSNLLNYINDEKLLSLPIPVLYRILNNSNLKIDQNEIIDFLFKCLDKYGREASVLFTNFDFENKRIDLYSRLMSNYSKVFDFNMINPKFLLNTTNELLSELNKLKIEFTNSILEMKKLIEEQKNQFNDHNELIKKMYNSQNEQINEQVEAIKAMKNSLNEQIKEQIESIKEMQNSQKEQINKQIESIKEMQISQKEQINKQIEYFNQTEINKQLKSRDERIVQCENSVRNLKNQNDEKFKSYITKDIFLFVYQILK